MLVNTAPRRLAGGITHRDLERLGEAARATGKSVRELIPYVEKVRLSLAIDQIRRDHWETCRYATMVWHYQANGELLTAALVYTITALPVIGYLAGLLF